MLIFSVCYGLICLVESMRVENIVIQQCGKPETHDVQSDVTFHQNNRFICQILKTVQEHPAGPSYNLHSPAVNQRVSTTGQSYVPTCYIIQDNILVSIQCPRGPCQYKQCKRGNFSMLIVMLINANQRNGSQSCTLPRTSFCPNVSLELSK